MYVCQYLFGISITSIQESCIDTGVPVTDVIFAYSTVCTDGIKEYDTSDEPIILFEDETVSDPALFPTKEEDV